MCGVTPSSWSVVTIRLGPSRLTSTALSSGESKATVAAEWMTTSQLASVARPASSRPSPSEPTSPAITVTRRATSASNAALPSRLAQAVEGVVAEHLACRTARDVRPLAGADQQHQLATGHAAQQPLHERRAQEAGAPGHGDALSLESLGDHLCLSTIW